MTRVEDNRRLGKQEVARYSLNDQHEPVLEGPYVVYYILAQPPFFNSEIKAEELVGAAYTEVIPVGLSKQKELKVAYENPAR